jgi:hypothetical protein
VPASFRLQGLVTLLAAYSRRARAGFVSHRRRSWDSPFGAFSSRKVSAAFPGGRTHIPFHPSVIPASKRRAGPTGRGSWALPLPRVPGDQAVFSSPTAGCSLGLRPLRVYQREPCPGLHPDSSHALCGLDLGDRTHRRLGVSIDSRLTLSAAPSEPDAMDKPTLPGSSHQHDPAHSSEPEPGLCVRLIPRRALLPTGR